MRSKGGTAAGPQEHWGSRAGFVFAMIGSAVGLGNIWRFPYLAGESGGGAFLVAYLLMLVAIGMPLLIAELVIGQQSQRAPIEAFARLADPEGSAPAATAPAIRSATRRLGWLSVLGAFVGLSYYTVLTGWVLKYLAVFAGVATGVWIPNEASWQVGFERFIARPLEPLLWHLAAMALTVVIVSRGVRRGIEAANRLLMPMLAVGMLGLAAYAGTLPGAAAGWSFLFRPEWSRLADAQVWIAALGQAFFSLGLASGVIITYGSYLRPGSPTAVPAGQIIAGDTLISLLAGLVVFPAVFTLGIDPTQGPTLTFVTLPDLFGRIPGGLVAGMAFFALLASAAITSAVSLLEVPVAALMQARRWPRVPATLAVGGAATLVGIPTSLGYGPLSGWTLPVGPGGSPLPLLDGTDALLSNLLLPVNGLLIAGFVGWIWNRKLALSASGLGAGRTAALWHAAMRWLVPAMIGLILLGSFGLI